jgi:hypothetical protein
MLTGPGSMGAIKVSSAISNCVIFLPPVWVIASEVTT